MRTCLLALLAALIATPAAAQLEINARGAEILLGGRMHTQFETSSFDGEGSDFFIRRARFNADADIGDFWDARVQVDFAGGGAALQDAWVRYAFAPGFRVSVGQFKHIFDLFELESTTNLSIIERDGGITGVNDCPGIGGLCSYGRFIAKLSFGGRDQGVKVEAGTGRLTFAGTVTNGDGMNVSDSNGGKSFDGRFAFEATDMLTLGLGMGVHDYELAGEAEYASAWSADLNWGTWRDGLHVQAAVTGGDHWVVPESPTFLTWQVVGTWYAPIENDRIAGIEPLFRISSGDPNTALEDDAGLLITPGLSLYISGRNKLGVNLDFWSPQTGDSEFSIKVQSFVYF